MAVPSDWLLEAEEDLATARVLTERAIYKQACFHAQQAVEKALKAVLLKRTGTIPRIHDLPGLLAQVRKADPELLDHGPAVQTLDPYYMLARYPDVRPRGTAMPVRDDADRALALAESVLNDLRPRAG